MTADEDNGQTVYSDHCNNPWHQTARARRYLACGECAPENYWSPGTPLYESPRTTQE